MIFRLLFLWLAFHGVATSADIRQTLFLEDRFVPGETLVWSPGFQKCWDEMRQFYKLDSPKFSVANPLVDKLNQFVWEYEKTVPNRSHFTVVAGTGEQYRSHTNKLLRRHFGDLYVPFPPGSFSSENVRGLVLMSIIRHDLAFNSTLKSNPEPFWFVSEEGKRTRAKSFGAVGNHRAAIAGEVHVIAFDEEQQRKAIILPGKDQSEELVLVADGSLTSPAAVITAANKWTKLFKENIQQARHYNDASDTIVVPEITFSVDSDLQPLFPGELDLGSQGRVIIARAGQNTGLRMSEKGASMVTKSYLIAPTFLNSGDASSQSIVKVTQNRNFIFDRPFFLMLRKKGAEYPFLFVKVDQSILVTGE